MNNIFPRFLTKSSTLTFITVPLKSKLHYTAGRVWFPINIFLFEYIFHTPCAGRPAIDTAHCSQQTTYRLLRNGFAVANIHISRTKPPITVVTVVWQVAQIHSQTRSFRAFNKSNQHKFRSILKLN